MKLSHILNSIRWRLLLWIGFLLAFVLLGFGWTGHQLHRTNQLNQIDAQLDQRVSFLSTSLRRPPGMERFQDGPGPGGQRPPPEFGGGFERERRPVGPPPGFRDFPGEPEGPMRMRMRGPREERDGPDGWREIKLSGEALRLFEETDTNSFYYMMWARGGRVLKQSTNAPVSLEIPLRVGRDTTTHTRMRGDFRESYHFTERGDCVLAGVSLTPFFRNTKTFSLQLAGVGGLVLALGLAGAWWLTSGAIRPVSEISTTANRIAAGNLSERIPLGETASELGQLAEVLNETFARLEAAFAQQKQFTADASHEIRTPLAVIISEAQATLNRDRTSEEYREALTVCLDAAQQMRGLADSLLELARFDAGEMKTEMTVVDLASIAERCVQLVRALARENEITIQTRFDSAPVIGNGAHLTQVVTNLLQNAIHYNHSGGTVTVETQTDKENCILTVADTGIGISQEDLPHIFKRFYRADKARSRQEGRTGLGLAIVKAIVDAHGGNIAVESTLGHGTTFTLRFPKAT